MNRQGAYVCLGQWVRPLRIVRFLHIIVGCDDHGMCLFRTLKEIFRQKRATTEIVALYCVIYLIT